MENTISQLLLTDSKEAILIISSFFGVGLFIVTSNWNKIKLPYEWLMAWYKRQKRKDEREQMIEDDHIKIELLNKQVSEMQEKINGFCDKQEEYHEQSIEIRGGLANDISAIAELDKKRDVDIDVLKMANMVLLGEKINKKYKEYIALHGIPEDEVDEFTNLHTVYKSLGGNHTGDAKFDYVMKHLDVIPVETKLIFDKE